MESKLNNADRLIGRILEEAQAEAEKTLEEARSEAKKAQLIAQDEVFEAQQGAVLRSKRVREGILERSRTNAALDSRKYALKARRQLVDKAFEKAAAALCALDGEKRLMLIKSTLLAEAEGGETVLPAAADAARVQAALAEVNAALKNKNAAPLTLGDAAEQLDGGFLLIAKGYEKNCSFSALLRDIRGAEESAVASILFG